MVSCNLHLWCICQYQTFLDPSPHYRAPRQSWNACVIEHDTLSFSRIISNIGFCSLNKEKVVRISYLLSPNYKHGFLKNPSNVMYMYVVCTYNMHDENIYLKTPSCKPHNAKCNLRLYHISNLTLKIKSGVV